MKKKIFVGSSLEALPYAQAVAHYIDNNLSKELDCSIWQEVFRPGDITVDRLSIEMKKSSFAVFLLTPDDLLIARGTTFSAPRDNVVFELGMFMGFLGREKVYFMVPKTKKGSTPFKIFSDAHSLTYIPFNFQKNPENIVQCVRSACYTMGGKIEEELLKEGKTKNDIDEETNTKELVDEVNNSSSKVQGRQSQKDGESEPLSLETVLQNINSRR